MIMHLSNSGTALQVAESQTGQSGMLYEEVVGSISVPCIEVRVSPLGVNSNLPMSCVSGDTRLF
jgi:hypothetical protein